MAKADTNTNVTVLNNSKRGLIFGDSSKGERIKLSPGATELPQKLFDSVAESDSFAGQQLRAHRKAGTLTIIDNATEPLEKVAASIASAREESELVAIACRDGRVEVRARLAQKRRLLMRDGHPVNIAHRHLFDTAPDVLGVNVSPEDLRDGWQTFVHGYKQRPYDSLAATQARQLREAAEHQKNVAALAAALKGEA